MVKTNVEYRPLSMITPYKNNPRFNDNAVEAVANSIKEFGFKVPIVVDKDGVIVTGHTRLKAAKKLGLKEVPVIVASDLTSEQIKAFRLADNKTAELAEWDETALQIELDTLSSIDMNQFGFEELEELTEEFTPESKYTTKVNIPQYEPTGAKVDIDSCLDTTKSEELIEKIREANIPQDLKDFLILASYRHNVFNYQNIAEYYANANSEVQELMEQSALVIIDYEDAVANGYAKLSGQLKDLFDEGLYNE